MKGCYCLVIKVDAGKKLKIGKRLKIDFKPGYYVYIGSAMNNLESRVKRHLSKTKKLQFLASIHQSQGQTTHLVFLSKNFADRRISYVNTYDLY